MIHWCGAGDVPPTIRDWGDDCAVFNPLSGDTHVLDLVAGEVLNEIIAGCTEETEIRAHVAKFLDVPNDERVAGNVGAILAHLDELGLIAPADPC